MYSGQVADEAPAMVDARVTTFEKYNIVVSSQLAYSNIIYPLWPRIIKSLFPLYI